MKLEDVEVFVEAVRAGSLAGAARRLSMSAMAASRALNALEAELGVRLVHRTTRSSRPPAMARCFCPTRMPCWRIKPTRWRICFPMGLTLPDVFASPPLRRLDAKSSPRCSPALCASTPPSRSICWLLTNKSILSAMGWTWPYVSRR